MWTRALGQPARQASALTHGMRECVTADSEPRTPGPRVLSVLLDEKAVIVIALYHTTTCTNAHNEHNL